MAPCPGAPPTAAASRGTIVIAFAGSSSGLKVGRFDTSTAASPTLDTIATLKDFEPRRARYVTSSLVVVVGADSSNRPSAAVVDISTTTLQLVYLHTASGTGAFHDVTVLGSMLVFVGESAGSAALWRCPSMSPCI